MDTPDSLEDRFKQDSATLMALINTLVVHCVLLSCLLAPL